MNSAIVAVAAATKGGLARNDGSSDRSALKDFPDEEPSSKQAGDWFDVVLPPLRLAFGALLRDETPTHLLQFDTADDLTGFDIVSDGTTGWTAQGIAAHNRKVREARAANQNNAMLLERGLRAHKDQLAQMLVASLQPNAPLLLERLLEEHKILTGSGDETGAHDGKAMLEALLPLRGSAGVTEETRAHDRAVEHMRDNPLADGCCVREYTLRVNSLIKNHVKHLERKLEGEALPFAIRRTSCCARARA